MKKIIIIFASLLQFISILMFIAIIKLSIAWSRGEISRTGFGLFLIIPIILSFLSYIIKTKFPNESKIAEDIIHNNQPHSKWLIIVLCTIVLIGSVLFAKFVSE